MSGEEPKPRARPRRRTLLSGVIVHGPHSFTTDCAVRDLSEGGARVRLAGLTLLGEPLLLLIPSLDQAYAARVAWREGLSCGLVLERAIDVRAPADEHEKAARRIWLERRAR